MAKKRIRTIKAPLGGVSRRLGFQSQPPFTCPDAVNFVPDSQDLGRSRGGSRGGLVRLYKTSASTAIQCLETVNVKESSEAFNFWSDSFEHDAFSSLWTTSNNVLGGLTSTAPSLSGGQLYGNTSDSTPQKVIYRTAPSDQATFATGHVYTLGMYVIPYANAHHGNYSIYFRLDASPSLTGDATAMEARLSITGTGTVSIQLYKQNSALGSAYTATDSVATEGWFEVSVTKGGTNDTIEVFWRGESLGSTSSSTSTTTDKNFAFGLKGTVTGGRVIVDRVRVQYRTSGFFELLRPRTVFIQGGQVFRETTTFQKFTASSSNLRCNASDQLVAAERGGKLYIADYGQPLAVGTDGVISNTGTRFDSATYTDWRDVLSTSTGTDTYFGNFVVHVLGFTSLASASDGVITVSGTTTSFDSATYSDWTTKLSSTPTADNYYGKYKLRISSAGPNYGSYEITAVAAGNLTLNGTLVAGTGLTFSLEKTTTRGAFPVTGMEASGAYLTISGTPGDDTGLTFRIERGPKVYDLASDSLTLWTATSGRGMIPVGCKSVARYRDRLVLAVDPLDPNEYYMSRLGDPLDWLFADSDVGAALKGSNSDAGKMGDAITALMPYSDDHIFFGCRSSLWIMRGDPAGGGRADMVSGSVGVIGLKSWCQGPRGEVMWLSRDGLYASSPDCLTCEPVSLSREKVPRELLDIDPQNSVVTMAYDVRNRIACLFIKPSGTVSGVRHWFFDWSNKGFFPIKFADTASYPTACCYINAADPEDSCLLLGCAGGSIKRFSWTAANDDAAAIASYVLIGPVGPSSNGYSDGMVQEFIAMLGETSGSVTWSLHVGDTAEDAYAASAFATGTWSAGSQYSDYPMARAAAYLVKITGTAGYRWSFEELSAVERQLGKQRA